MLAAFFVAALLAVAGAGAYLGAAVVARHRTQSAADLAALAAAVALPDGADAACARAREVLAANVSGDMADCRVEGLDVVVTVVSGRARAAARAGPVDG